MRIFLMWDGPSQEFDFPMPTMELLDVLDQMHSAPGNTAVDFEIVDCDSAYAPLDVLYGQVFRADIFKLNLFAHRYEMMEKPDRIIYQALLSRFEPTDFEQVLRLTYGLEQVPCICAKDVAELGRFSIENAMLPEIERCPEEMLPLLGRTEVGKAMLARNGGVLIDGYYCEPEHYEMPDIRIEIQKPEDVFFRLLIGRMERDDRDAQWLSLPCTEEQIHEIEVSQGLVIGSMYCYRLDSCIPEIGRASLSGMRDFHLLNDLAKQLAGLEPLERRKLKAVMELEELSTLQDALDAVGRLPAYQFDPAVNDNSDYAQEFLTRNLPEQFDADMLAGVEMQELGANLLRRMKGQVTAYGAIARCDDLYALPVMEPELDETPQMGGMA